MKRLLLAVTVPQSIVLLRGKPRRFKELGYDVHLVSGQGTEAETIASEEGLTHHPAPIPRLIHPIKDAFALLKVIAILAKVRPQIVNTGTPKAGLLVSIAAWLLCVPVRIYTIRGLRYDSENGILRAILIAMEKMACRCAQLSVCISRSMMEMARKDLGGSPRSYLMVGAGSSNGIDLSRFKTDSSTAAKAAAFRKEHNIPLDAPLIGYLGRINKRKGVEELLEAWQQIKQRYPNAYLALAGAREEAQKPSDQFFAAVAADPQVIETGHLQNVEVFLSAIDIFTLPAHWEGFGNVLIQAAAMGKPIVTTRTIGCVDAASEGYNSLMVPPHNPDELAHALLQYLDNPDLRERHGANGLQWASRFDQNAIWNGLDRLYRELWSQANGSVL